MTTFHPAGPRGPWDPGPGWEWWAGQGAAVGGTGLILRGSVRGLGWASGGGFRGGDRLGVLRKTLRSCPLHFQLAGTCPSPHPEASLGTRGIRRVAGNMALAFFQSPFTRMLSSQFAVSPSTTILFFVHPGPGLSPAAGWWGKVRGGGWVNGISRNRGSVRKLGGWNPSSWSVSLVSGLCRGRGSVPGPWGSEGCCGIAGGEGCSSPASPVLRLGGGSGALSLSKPQFPYL